MRGDATITYLGSMTIEVSSRKKDRNFNFVCNSIIMTEQMHYSAHRKSMCFFPHCKTGIAVGNLLAINVQQCFISNFNISLRVGARARSLFIWFWFFVSIGIMLRVCCCPSTQICLWHSFLYSVIGFFSLSMLSANTYNNSIEFLLCLECKNIHLCKQEKKNHHCRNERKNKYFRCNRANTNSGTHVLKPKQNQMLWRYFFRLTGWARRFAWNRDMADNMTKKIRRTTLPHSCYI